MFQRAASKAAWRNEVIRQIQSQRDEYVQEIWNPTVSDDRAYNPGKGCWREEGEAERQDNPKVGNLSVPSELFVGLAATNSVRGQAGRDSDNIIIVFFARNSARAAPDQSICWQYASRLDRRDGSN